MTVWILGSPRPCSVIRFDPDQG